MKEELKQLIAATGQACATQKAKAAARKKSVSDRRAKAAAAIEKRREASASTVFGWLVSPDGQDLLLAMRASGLDRVVMTTKDGQAAILSDGRIEFQRSIRYVGGQQQTFSGSADYIVWARKLTSGSDSYTCFDSLLDSVAADVAAGRVLDNITTGLRTEAERVQASAGDSVDATEDDQMYGSRVEVLYDRNA